MQFTNLTRSNEIGANCYYIRSNDHGFLLDCGAHPKIEGVESLPRLDLLADKPFRTVLLSHGHLDHIGSLPVILRERPEARAYLTAATGLIADRALHNSVSVMTRQRIELNLPEYPLFTHGEVDRLMDNFASVPYNRPLEIEGARITYYEAGHVQGAAGIWIQDGPESLFYTGDVKFSDMRITRAARFPEQSPDTIVIECTRGSTPSQPDFTWDREVQRLTVSIQETYANGGSVLIPCFALGKMQEVLKLFYDLMQQGLLPEQGIFISGLGRSYTEIYDDLAGHSPRVCPGFKIREKLQLEVLESQEARFMKIGRGRLMLISSGMMTPHTMSHTMAQRFVTEERHSIFFVGYVDPDSPAGKLKAAGRGGRADFGGDVGEIDIGCRVESFDLTSHCNREHMADYVARLSPRNVLLVHGDSSSLAWFQQELKSRLPNSRIIIPPSGETLRLN